MSIFSELNKLDENDNWIPEIISNEDAIDGLTVIIVDDAKNYNIDNYVKSCETSWRRDELLTEDEKHALTPKIVVSKDHITDLINAIAHANIFDIKKTYKNQKLKHEFNLTKEDQIKILKQLQLGDYSYTLESYSDSKFPETLLTVFTTKRNFELTRNRTLENIKLYIKLRYTNEEGVICVVSLHGSESGKIEHPYNNLTENSYYCVNLSDIIKHCIFVVSDNAKIYDVSKIEAELNKDFEDEEDFETIYESKTPSSPRIILSKDNVKTIIDKLASPSTIFDISNNWKNNEFKKIYNLSDEDLKTLIRQLSIRDYCYTVNSTHALHQGALLTIFITSKHLEVKDIVFENIILYIKVEILENGSVCVVSFHPSHHENSHPYEEENN